MLNFLLGAGVFMVGAFFGAALTQMGAAKEKDRNNYFGN